MQKKHGGTSRIQFWKAFQFENPQIHQFQDKNCFIDLKNLVSILSWNQGKHFMGHLWIQTNHNLDHKCPDYDQSGIMLFLLWQSMISLFLFGRSNRDAVYHGHDQNPWQLKKSVCGKPISDEMLPTHFLQTTYYISADTCLPINFI